MYDLTNTIKIAKSMKRPIVHISNNYMLGTDEEFCTLSIIEINSEIPRPFTAHINEILSLDAAEKLSQKNSAVFLAEYTKISDSHYYRFWDEERLYTRINNIFSKVFHIVQFNPLEYHENLLEKDPEFMSCMKLKVSDGLVPYIIDNKYLFTNFNKVQPINSADKVSLNIYYMDYISNLYEFLIDKKKYVIKEYIRYRKMR